MIYLLTLYLIFIAMISYLLNRKDLTAPAFIFSLFFTLCAFMASIYAEQWELINMYDNTFMVIAFGTTEFIVIAFLIKSIFSRAYSNKYKYEVHKLKVIKVDPIIKVICIIYCMLIIVLTIKFVLEISGGNILDLKSAISSYDSIKKFSAKNVVPPKFLGISLIILNGMVYWYTYVVINNFIANKKIDVLSIMFILLWIINSLLEGGRNGAINLILGAIAMYYILLKKKHSFRKNIHLNVTTKIAIISMPIIFIMIFPQMAKMLGRNTSKSPLYYFSIYCGAEVKNLDIYLQERDIIKPKYSNNNQTFNVLINWIGPKLGLIDKSYKLDLPFRSINGLALGNVCTTFYPYIYDFGYEGVIICTAIIAFISQFVYEKCKREETTDTPGIWTLIYGYMFSSLVLSFFSNKFFEQNFSKVLIFSIIIWKLANYFFIKLKFIKCFVINNKTDELGDKEKIE